MAEDKEDNSLLAAAIAVSIALERIADALDDLVRSQASTEPSLSDPQHAIVPPQVFECQVCRAVYSVAVPACSLCGSSAIEALTIT